MLSFGVTSAKHLLQMVEGAAEGEPRSWGRKKLPLSGEGPQGPARCVWPRGSGVCMAKVAPVTPFKFQLGVQRKCGGVGHPVASLGGKKCHRPRKTGIDEV